MKEIIKNFENNGFKVSYFEDENQARNYLSTEIQDTTVAFGGSMTCLDIDLHNLLREKNQVLYHSADGTFPKSYNVYISSANALSKTGEIVNIDGTGNRVSGTIFGPEKVYIICGVNKIADTLDEAIFRAQNIAAPLNAKRLNRKTPCASSDKLKCFNCNSAERICRTTVIMNKKSGGISHFEIILINKKLGF